ncbi:MAG TPA: hypothetical protein VK427_10890 [Kofleriaceae bacterium]|nr:hypothetical protein [Kofleriaceae bacterium]
MYPIHSWLRAFFALLHTAIDARGSIEINPGTDAAAEWPLTIGADVISIAAVIDQALRAYEGDADASRVVDEWRSVIGEIASDALTAPLEVYAGNRDFWRALSRACLFFHARDAELPPPVIWTALLDQLGERIEPRNVGPSGATPFQQFAGVKTFDDLFIAQRRYLTELRGADEREPEPGMTGAKKPIPRTTNGDVIALADYWTKQLGRVKRVPGADVAEKAWRATIADVDALARKAEPAADYAKNNAFWRALQQTAIHVAVADEAPTQTDLMLDALKTSLGNLPTTIKTGAKAIASGATDIAGSIAHGVGKVANEAGRGLFGGFGVPILIGGGLVGLFLLSRGRGSERTP